MVELSLPTSAILLMAALVTPAGTSSPLLAKPVTITGSPFTKLPRAITRTTPRRVVNIVKLTAMRRKTITRPHGTGAVRHHARALISGTAPSLT